MHPSRLAQALVDIPSETGHERPLADYIAAILAGEGLTVALLPVDDERVNVLANYSGDTRVIFCTHMDTVPPFIGAHRDETHLYGRGACDAKGTIAAMIEAGKRLWTGNKRRFALLFVVGEETDSAGARAAAAAGLRSQFIVVGEPTDNALAVGQKGSLSYSLRTTGVAGHSAYPERGVSAIDSLLSLLHDLRRTDWGFNPTLGPGTLNIGTIAGGLSANTIAPSAEAKLFHRLVDGVEERRKQVIEIVGDRGSIEFHAQNDPQELTVVEGFKQTVVNFGSDVPYLRTIARPLLVGPGSIHDAHTTGERVAHVELENAVDIYCRLYDILVTI